MNLRIAKKIAKTPERYSPSKVKQSQRTVEGLPVGLRRSADRGDHSAVVAQPRRLKSANRYRNVKSRNPKLAKYKFPWIN